MVDAGRQLIVFAAIACVVIVSVTWLVAIGALDAQAYVALVGTIVGGIVGILNPVNPSRPPSA